MKYLKKFSSHNEYEAASGLEPSAVVFDGEHLHYASENQDDQEAGEIIATFVIVNGSLTEIGYKKSIYKFADINVKSSEITDDAYLPCMICDEQNLDFSVIVSIDGVQQYKLADENATYLVDDMIADAGESDLSEYSGKYMVTPVNKTYGITYNGESYWYSGNGSVYNDADAADAMDGTKMTKYYSYKSDDDETLHVSISQNELRSYNGGDTISITLYHTNVLTLDSSETISVTVATKF